MAYGVSLDHMAFSDLKCYSFQPGHGECTAEKWRSRQPVWIFCCLPPTAQTCQKEPVSESKQFVSLELIKRLSYCLVFSTRLLVGAPRAKHQNQVNVTGVVYKCDLTTTSKSCQPIEFDDKGLCTLSEAIFIIVLW